jgi:anti-sigma regulatory factor (Ser/Thr protein kinase)
MGSMRQTIRVAALQDFGPANVLAVAERALGAEEPGRFVTAFIGCLSADRTRLTYASAGHPAPFVHTAASTQQLLLGGPPLGVADYAYDEYTIVLDTPWILVAYTDGLIERTGDAVRGEAAVYEAVAHDGIMHAHRPAAYVRERALGSVVHDDTAILTVRTLDGSNYRFSATDALRAESTRRNGFLRWISERAEGDHAAAELIYGELVGNVVRHAPGPIDVDVACEGDDVVLYLQDSGNQIHVHRGLPDDIMSESGRGLFLVNAFARDVRSDALPVFGHQMRVTLPLHRRP